NFILTIDGPAASGKSTTARIIANKLNWLYLDTGAMYRALAVKIVQNNIALDDSVSIGKIADETEISIKQTKNGMKVFLDQEDISNKIRTPEIDRAVGPVCEVPQVREVLVRLQRKIGSKGNIVAEGRDMGTVVFPKADLKIFLIASLPSRAERRLKDMKKMGLEISKKALRQEIQKRDKRDASRAHSPLKKAEDSIVLDTTHLSIAQQVDFILNKISEVK
ncbi:MAG: (d)CMP kinase, partial [bacterium]